AGGSSSPLTPECASSKGRTNNDNAETFAGAFPQTLRAVAAIVRVRDGISQLLGTAFLGRGDVLITAGHVIDVLTDSRVMPGLAEVGSGEFWAVFDMTVTRFPKGFPKALKWASQPGAVRIQTGSKTYRVLDSDPRVDVGGVLIQDASRPPLILENA